MSPKLVGKMLFGIICLVLLSTGTAYKNDKILIGNVKSLTLYRDQKTTGKRTKPVRQIKCVGGSAGCKSFIPPVVQCYNKGHDGESYQWKCKAEMPKMYQFGKVMISCEGYEDKYDEYILRGSCGLEYYLELTEDYSKNSQGPRVPLFLRILITALILCIIVYMCNRNRRNGNQRPNHPRPPPNHPPQPGFRREFVDPVPPPAGFRSEVGDSGTGPPPSQPSSNLQNRRAESVGVGGFLAGAASGAALGYAVGSRNNNQSSTSQIPQSSEAHHTSTGYGGTTMRTSIRTSASHDTPTSSWYGDTDAAGQGGTNNR